MAIQSRKRKTRKTRKVQRTRRTRRIRTRRAQKTRRTPKNIRTRRTQRGGTPSASPTSSTSSSFVKVTEQDVKAAKNAEPVIETLKKLKAENKRRESLPRNKRPSAKHLLKQGRTKDSTVIEKLTSFFEGKDSTVIEKLTSFVQGLFKGPKK